MRPCATQSDADMTRALSEDVHVKFSKEDLATLVEVCKGRGESISAFIRTATLQRLAEFSPFPSSRQKALLGSFLRDYQDSEVAHEAKR
jgi:hypothetical protein